MAMPSVGSVERTLFGRCAVVGAGRMGHALVAALAAFEGPFGRGFDGAEHDVVLLAVPDGQIVTVAAAIAPGRLVGHCSGASGLDVLAPHERFAVHPLMTVTDDGAEFAGAGAAIAGSTPHALAVARSITTALRMNPFEIAESDRAAYHAAASIAANFLTTIEDAAETLLATVGGRREILVPLVRASLENWAAVGGERSLTGPISRGDEATVTRQRAAIAERLPELLDLFDVLTAHTRNLANRRQR